MSNAYAINTSTLTALGDAVRGATGKYKKPTFVETIVKWSGTAQPGTNNTYYTFTFTTETPAVKIRLISSSGPMPDFKVVSTNFTFDENGEYFYSGIEQSMWSDWRFNLFVRASNITEPFTFEIGVIPYGADGNPVLQEGEGVNTMTLSQMTEELNQLSPGPTAEDLTITGDCSYRFAYGGWDWFINKYGKKITTSNISNLSNAFYGSNVANIDFDLNCGDQPIDFQSTFNSCINITKLPKTNNLILGSMTYAFNECNRLREFNSEFLSGLDYSSIQGSDNYYGFYNLFNNCYSLRKLPIDLLKGICSPYCQAYDTYLNSGFYGCYNLDEAINLPVTTNGAWTENVLSGTFQYCCRLKELTFETNDDGTPKVAEWANQVLDLSNYVGYLPGQAYVTYITDYNSGIEKSNNEVTDSINYNMYKNSPDWYTHNFACSRYNKQSAINTINSLPDTSEFANENGSNLIMFKYGSGSLTDGGDIKDLTDEEIAVAVAKGWTVSLV